MSGEDNGLSNQQLLLEIRADLKAHIASYNKEMRWMERELERRPTRREAFSWLGVGLTLAGLLSGIVFGILSAA